MPMGKGYQNMNTGPMRGSKVGDSGMMKGGMKSGMKMKDNTMGKMMMEKGSMINTGGMDMSLTRNMMNDMEIMSPDMMTSGHMVHTMS